MSQQDESVNLTTMNTTDFETATTSSVPPAEPPTSLIEEDAHFRTTHEYPEIRTDDGSRPQDDQELRDEVNEQMNLFWGAVSSAFAQPATHDEHHEQLGMGQEGVSGEVVHAEEANHQEEQVVENGTQLGDERVGTDGSDHHIYPSDSVHGEAAHDVNDEDHRMHDSIETHAAVEDSTDHPRNEWEHVQLLMSLGGQLGQDLAVLEDGQGGAEMQGGYLDREDGPSGGASHDPEFGPSINTTNTSLPSGLDSEILSRPHTRRTQVAEQPNAEAGPSRLPDAAHTDPGTPPEPKTRKRAARQSKPKTNPDGTPKPVRPKVPRKPRQGSGTTPSSPATPRPLLSAAEKRANHVSSEKRRRNAIRIGYAELGALEHMSVNRLWPLTGDLEAVIEESKDMEGMEELTGRKRSREGDSQTGEVGDDPAHDPAVTNEAGSGAATGAGAGAGTKSAPKRPRKGIYIVDQGMTSKSAILNKGASLAQWLTEGNAWLRAEVERLEGLLGVVAGQPLDPQDEVDIEEEQVCEPEEVEDTGAERQVRHVDEDYDLDGEMGLGVMDEMGIHSAEVGDLERQLMMNGGQDVHLDHVEHDIADNGDQHQNQDYMHHHQAEDGHVAEEGPHHDEHDVHTHYDGHDHHADRDHQHDEQQHHDHHDVHHHLIDPPTTIEQHFIQAVEALRPAQEEIGPDGYPRDMY